MRKIIIVLLLAAFMMNMLWGCQKPSDFDDMDTESTDERFIYSSRMYGILIRYDIIDKKAVIACPDPLCKHRKDCPVTNIYTSYVSKDYIMYGKLEDGLLSGKTIYCYDLKNGTIVKVLECPRYQDITFIQDAAYFSASHVTYNADGSSQGEVWDVYRYNLSSHELIKLNDEDLVSEVCVENYTKDQIVWFDFHKMTGFDYFSTDYDFHNIAPANRNLKIENYDYEISSYYGEDGALLYGISRMESSTGVSEEVLKGVASYRLDNIDDPRGIVYNTYQNDDGRTIFYKQLSDLTVKELCRIPDDYSLSGDEIYPNIGTTLYAGGYIGIYVLSKDAEHSEYHSGNTMLFVNIKTGDTFVLAP